MSLHPDCARAEALARRIMTPRPRRVQEERARERLLVEALSRPPEPVSAVHDLSLRGPGGPLRLRRYRPLGPPSGAALVYLHGGAWRTGDLVTADRRCRRLANASGQDVLSVAYRLPPEHPCPAAVEDACWAFTWAVAHAHELGIHAGRIGLGGESAGANVAASAALRLARNAEGQRPAFQLLLVPALDHPRCARLAAAGTHPASAGLLRAWDAYARGRHPAASPMQAPEVGGLPPSAILTAQHDVLAADGRRWAERLRAASVPTAHRCVAGMSHNFMVFDAIVAADDAFAFCGSALREAAATRTFTRA